VNVPVLGVMTPYFGAGGSTFDQFVCAEISGLARVRNTRVDFLALAAHEKGHGAFTRLLSECKTEYSTIGVWEIGNAKLYQFLKRNGFRAVAEVLDGELSAGLRWDRT
jgi:hypothetical protein